MNHLSLTLLSLLVFSYTLLAAPRDIGHTDTDYGYWDPSSLSTVTVTSLADSGTGTLRALLDGVSNVRVAFAVEGEIKLQSDIAPGSSVFIDGSTAPGQGVSISGDQLNFGAQSNIWIQDIAFLGGDYMLPMPSRMTAFEDQGSGVWLDDSSRFWARLTADTHIDSVWHSSIGDLSVMTQLTKGSQISVDTLTQSAGTATCVTSSAHGLTTGDLVYVNGANETEYNIGASVTVSNTTTFTFSVDAGASSPATGTILVTDLSSAGWYFDASDGSLVVATGNGDGSDVNNGTMAIQLSKSLHPDCITLNDCTQIVLAHNTFLGGTDITMQVDNCRYTWLYANIIGRPIGYRYQVEQTDANIAKGAWSTALHAKGILFKMDAAETNKNLNTGLARNFFIDCPDRSPRLADGGSYLLLNNYNVSTDGMNITLQNDTFGDGVASVIGNYFDTTSQTDYSVIHGVPEIEVDANGTIYLADGTPDEANYWDGALQTDPWAKQNTGFFKADDNSDKAETVVVPSPSTNPDPTAQGGGASTITLDAATSSAVDDTYNNHYIVLTANTGSGQQAFITDYDGTSKVATVNTAWSTQPDNTTTYEIRYGVLPASILTAAHDTVTGYTILSAADAKTWVAANAGPRRDRNRPAIVNELADRAVTPPASFYWPTNDGIRPAGGYDPDAEDYIRRARLLDPVAFNQTSISDSYTSLTIEAAVSNMIERLKDANVWEDTTEWINMAGVSYDGLAAKLKRDTSETIVYQSDFSSTVQGFDDYTLRSTVAAGTASQDGIGGEDNTLQVSDTAALGFHLVAKSILTEGKHYSVCMSVNIPSGNATLDGFSFTLGHGAGFSSNIITTKGEWVKASAAGVALGSVDSTRLLLVLRSAGSTEYTGATESVYIKDIIVRAVSPAEMILNNFSSGNYLAAGSGAGLTGVPASTTYINSGYWFPNFDGNDLHLGAYVANNSSSPSMALLGATDSTSNVVSLEDDSVNFEVNLPDSDAQIAGGSSASGYLLGSRRSSTDIESYFNGVSAATDASSLSFSSGDIAENLAVFARLDDVAGEEFLTDATLAAAHYGNGWTDAQALAAYKALRDFLRTIGAN